MENYSDRIKKEIRDLNDIDERIVNTRREIEETIELLKNADENFAKQVYLGKFERLNERLDNLEGLRSEKSRNIMRIWTFRVSGLTKNMKHDQE